MNIVGEGFPKEINDQVTKRQQVYGSGYIEGTLRSSEEILYLNANTSWCKLVSSVDITDQSIIQDKSLSGVKGIEGSNLAKQFMLFNGVKNQYAEQRSGIDFTNSTLGNNNAYGIGGTEFGLNPMMGLQSAEIKSLNRGSIRQASVKIKAWNKVQFEIIDLLYLRLGFSILLEWGHTMWYGKDNNGNWELHTGGDIDNSLSEEFLSGKLNYNEFLKLIQKRRILSYGNYDAMFGRVTNFHWSFQKDGSYDIELNLISVGDVMESFKMNALNTFAFKADSTSSSEEDDKVPIEEQSDADLAGSPKFGFKHSIGNWFYRLITYNEVKKAFIREAQGKSADSGGDSYAAESTGQGAEVARRAQIQMQVAQYKAEQAAIQNASAQNSAANNITQNNAAQAAQDKAAKDKAIRDSIIKQNQNR